MRFQAAAPDARAIVYARIQADPLVGRVADLLLDASPAERVLARAVMNGESGDPGRWRAMVPAAFDAATAGADGVAHAERLLAACLDVAGRGEQSRSQFRGAIVEELTARLLARRVPAAVVHRERRVLFDGVAAEIHPYDVTVELADRGEVYDCKWGSRGINADVLHQLDDARRHAVSEEARLLVALVIFDSRRSCEVRLARQTAPRGETRLYSIETLGKLAGAARAAEPAAGEVGR
jgi:hypothetical protein